MIVYLAGTEADGVTLRVLPKKIVSSAFASYYYLRANSKSQIERLRLIRDTTSYLTIDSGAHTFFSESELVPHATSSVKKSRTKATPDEYFDKYFEWLKENIDNFDYYVELDIGEIVGQNKVNKWRDRLAAAGLAHKCIIVYHPVNAGTPEYFCDYAREWPSRYIGLEGYTNGVARINHNFFLKFAYENRIRAHGFAMTKQKVLESMPFYSVDSTSGKAPLRYGGVFMERGPGNFGLGQLKRPKTEEQKQKVAAQALKHGITLDFLAKQRHGVSCGEMDEGARHETLEASYLVYRKMQNYWTSFWKARGVDWETRLRETHTVPETPDLVPWKRDDWEG